MVWEDISEVCRRTASQLDAKKAMISTPEFSLLDSMSAVELMDPKMDQCFQLRGSVRVEDLLNPTLPSEITPDIVWKIMKILVSYEVAFYDGASVLESTHNCIYMWEDSWCHLQSRITITTSSQERAVLQALLVYCKSLYSSLWDASQAILEADIFEDEDFQPQVSPWVGKGISLSEAHEELNVAMHAVASLPIQNSCTSEIQAMLRSRMLLHKVLHSLGAYVSSSLRYSTTVRKLVMQTARSYLNLKDLDAQSGDADEKLSTSHQKLFHEKGNFPEVQKLYVAYESALSVAAAELCIEQDAACSAAGAQEDEGEGEVLVALASSDIAFAFSNTLVRTQQSSPIRRVVLRSYLSSRAYLHAILSQLLRLGKLQNDMIMLAAQGPDGLLYDHILSVAMRVCDDRFHLLSRSLFLSCLHVLTCEHMQVFIAASMRSWGLPSVLVEGDLVRHNWIPETLCKVFFESLKCLCVCRNKVLVKTDNLLSNWATVMGEAEQIDAQFRHEIGLDISDSRQAWCSYWCLTLLGQLMDVHFCVLIESQLLGVNELDYFYWYWDHICGVRLVAQSNLLKMQYELHRQMYQEELKTYRAEVARGKPHGSAAVAPAMPTPPPIPAGLEHGPPSSAVLALQGRKELCRGLLRVAAALAKTDTCVHAPNARKLDNKYTAWSLRFMQRFRAFQYLPQPAMLTYEAFVRTVGEENCTGGGREALQLVQDIVEAAAACFKDAKALFDAARKVPESEHRNPSDVHAARDAPILLKVAIASSVQCMQLLMAMKKQLSQDPHESNASATHKKMTIDSKLNAHFPVIKLE